MNSKKSFLGIDDTRSMVLAALVAALYVVLTTVLSALSFGPFQVRLSEMFNHLVVFNKRYIVAVTLGVFISNIIASPFGFLDIVTGTVQTLLALLVMYWLSKFVHNRIAQMAVNTVVAVFFMCMIAWEIAIVGSAAFWPTFWANWLSIGWGELVSMVVGGVVVYFLSLAIDFTK
ncbi:QueT transporter family protein [Levilactobacillus yiduensis]|uniref:QueT transporter family protein n=1 Tax=Levilactobacillus yiduensis TaxID=2953880 RepID=UPI000EF2B252|nr:QueT transporter family protein [Levilactobacillus yiduensis]AYM04008.1 QueT transporter family protein [Levilactobacillus brevis]